jgi:S1-C subfamily serine protease
MNDTGTEFGLAVEHVYPDSPADQAGLKRGDIISKYNGKTITASNINDAWYDLYYSLSSNISVGVYDSATKRQTHCRSAQVHTRRTP